MKSIEIKINEKFYTVKTLPIGRYAEILDVLNKLPEIFSTINAVSKEEVLKVLPKVTKDALPELIKVISIGSGVEENVISEEMGLIDIAELFVAIWDVNDFTKLGNVLGRLHLTVVKAPETIDGSKN